MTVTRSTISPKGFSNRKRNKRERFGGTKGGTITKLGGSEELGIEYKVTLSHEPSKIEMVEAFTKRDSDQSTYTGADGRKRRRRFWKLKPASGAGNSITVAAGRKYQQDTYSISSGDPKEIIINEYVREYDSERVKFSIKYVFDEKYDPGY